MNRLRTRLTGWTGPSFHIDKNLPPLPKHAFELQSWAVSLLTPIAMATRKMRAFKRWMKSQGIDCSDALELVLTNHASSPSPSSPFSVSVTALCDLQEGDIVARIPKESCLTIKTSRARHVIEATGLDGFLGLAVAVMYERSLGPLSNWFDYLQLMPFSEPIPLLWSDHEIDSLLVGTELYKVNFFPI